MVKNKKFKFEINRGHLLVGDDEIYLNWVNLIGIKESMLREGEYAIYLHTTNTILELYYTGNRDEVYTAFEELSREICEKYPVFFPMFHNELVNFRNIQEISHFGGMLTNSKVKITFKRGEDLVRLATKAEYKNIKSDFEEYKESRKKSVTV